MRSFWKKEFQVISLCFCSKQNLFPRCLDYPLTSMIIQHLGIQRGFEVTCMSTSWLWKEASLRMAESFRLYSLNTVVLKSLKFLEANSKLAVFLCFLQSSPSALKIPSPSSTSIYEWYTSPFSHNCTHISKA